MFRLFKQGNAAKLIIAITTSQFSSGNKFTASSITATFYKLNDDNDDLEIDTDIGIVGVVTLTANKLGKTGWHTALVDFSAITAKQYIVVFEATVDSVTAIAQEFLDVSAELASLPRILGLVMENLVEEVTSRDSNGNKLTSVIYLYDSAANATTHDKATGLKASYDITASYTSNLMDLFKSVKAS